MPTRALGVVQFRGREDVTLELDGTCEGAALSWSPVFEPECEGGRLRVNLCVLRLFDLGVRGLPGPRFDYVEALWRVRGRWRSAPAWLVLRCDVWPTVPRWLAAILDRYETRAPERFSVEGDARGLAVTLRADGHDFSLQTSAEGQTASALSSGLSLLTLRGGAVHHIPWQDDATAEATSYACTVRDEGLGRASLGATVEWAPRAVVSWARVHACAPAYRVGRALR